MTDLGLKNKTAVITGSSRGIGKAIAVVLAENGVSVFINGRNKDAVEATVQEFLKKGLNAHGFAGDVSNEKEVKNFIDSVRGYSSKIDILVNNAGISEVRPLEEITKDIWDKYLNNNLTSAFLMCREVLPYMKQQGGGKIINISSVAGIEGRSCGTHYSSSKAGLIGFTKALSKDAGRLNIQVNCIAPGVIDTDLTRRLISKSSLEEVINKTPLGRIGRPEDIAKAVLFLSSDLSDFITGQILIVNGGK